MTVADVLSRSPDILIIEAIPSDLSCCGLITQLKSQPNTESSLKVVMIVQGGALERARALDLGTDDVISFPFDAVEFAARIRTRLRERHPEELKTMLKYAVQREHYADIATESLRDTASERRSWAVPVFLALSAAPVLAAAFASVSSRVSRKEARGWSTVGDHRAIRTGESSDFCTLMPRAKLARAGTHRFRRLSHHRPTRSAG